jgi:hypothetical protein
MFCLFRTLLPTSETLHDMIVQTIIRNGFDQCQTSLRKLTSQRYYRRYTSTHNKKMNTANPISFHGSNDDLREFKMDALREAMEEILSKLRYYSKLLKSKYGPSSNHVLHNRNDASSNSGSSAGGWMSPKSDFSMSPPASQERWSGANEQSMIIMSLPMDRSQPDPDSLDMHPYASKKRPPKHFVWKKRTKKKKHGTSFTDAKVKRMKMDDKFESRSDSDFELKNNCDKKDEADTFGKNDKVDSEINIENTRSFKDLPKDLSSGHIRQRKKQRSKGISRNTNSSASLRQETKINDENRPSSMTNRDPNTLVKSTSALSSKIPDFEKILPPLSHTDDVGIPHKVPGRRRHEKRCISDRMGKWLESNLENSKLNIESATDNSRVRNSINKTRTKDNDDGLLYRMKDSVTVLSPKSMRQTQNLLFSSLYKKRGTSPVRTTQPVVLLRVSDLKELCHSLTSVQSDELFKNSLDDICSRFEDNSQYLSSDASSAFQAMYDSLCRDDIVTMQHLVSSESPCLSRFVALLVAILRLLKHNVSNHLTASDGIIFDIFGLDRCHVFVEYVLLQLVDTLMSIFHPMAWNLRLRNPQKVLDQLEPLRNALGYHFDLIERVCECISQELGLQEWRCVCDGDGIFVSSINPDDWSAFLTSGTAPHKPTTIRYTTFECAFPRCEIDAVWCLLAFFAGTSTTVRSNDDNRWHFVSQLLVKGSLSLSQNPNQLPPSIDQLEAAVADLTNVTDLVASGTMGTLPRRDTFIIDVIQRVLSLECDYLVSNRNPWNAFGPSTSSEKIIAVLAGLFQKTSINLSSAAKTSNSLLQTTKELASVDVEINWMGQPLLLPTSRLLRCCLALLLSWKSQIPVEKVKRLQCFDNVIKALVKTLINENVPTDADNKLRSESHERDAFGDAFDSAGSEKDDTESRKILFRQESAAYITLFASCNFSSDNGIWYSLSKQVDEATLCKFLWNIVSDDSMRQLQEWIASKDCRSLPPLKYCGDKFRLHIAAKAISFIGIVIAGKHPLELDALLSSRPMDDISTVAFTEGNALSSLNFLLSCLLACVACACDMTYNPAILSSIVNCTSIMLKLLDDICSFRNDLVLDNSNSFPETVEMKQVTLLIHKANTLHRSFHVVLQSPSCGSEDDLCFQSVVFAIRIALTFYPTNLLVEATSANIICSEAAGTDDNFDDIDDDALANLDLGCADEHIKESKGQKGSLYLIYNMFSDALQNSKPSSRNSILQHARDDNACMISAQGMKLVNRNSNIVCAALAEIASTRWHPSCSMNFFWNMKSRFNLFDDSGDTLYFKALATQICRHMCQSYNSKIVKDILLAEGDSFLLIVLEAIMDHKVLRKIPSCNLDRICLRSGSIAEAQGFTELVNFRNGVTKRLCEGLIEVQSFCRNVSRLFLSIDDDTEPLQSTSAMGHILMIFSNEEYRTQLIPSLEREFFYRYKLFQELIVHASTQVSVVATFERVSALLLASCSHELVLLLQRIGIQDQAYRDVQRGSYSHSKLFETVACFTELLVNLVLETFRCQFYKPRPSSDDFISILRHIRDHFISPLLIGQRFNLLTSLREVVHLCSSFLSGTKPNVARTGTLFLSNFDMSPYSDLIRKSFIRRCRELVLSVATNIIPTPSLNSSKLLNAILVAGISNSTNVAAFIGRSFSGTEFYGTATMSAQDSIKVHSPLEHWIDNEYAEMEKSALLSVDHLDALRKLKRFVVQDFAIPKLSNNGIDARTKVLVLRMVQSIVDGEQDERMRYSNPTEVFDVLLLCTIAKGIGVSIRNVVVESGTINDQLIDMSYRCARSIMNLPADCIDPKLIGWLVDWAHPTAITSSNTIHSNYLWYIFCWLQEFGEAVLDTCSGGTRLQTIRDQMKTTNATALWFPVEMAGSSPQIAPYLNVLEEQVFPKFVSTCDVMILNKYNTVGSVRNVQPMAVECSNETKSESVPIDEWVPSLDVQYSIRQFIEKIKLATPTRSIPISTG